MWLQKNQCDRNDGVNGIVAVAIDADKGSQYALKWAIANLLKRDATVVLIHVKVKPRSFTRSPFLFTPRMNDVVEKLSLVCKDPDDQTKEISRPYCDFCARKDIHCNVIMLEHEDVSKALIEYASQSAIEHLVIGSSNRSGFLRPKVEDIPGTVSKGAQHFCKVYVVDNKKDSICAI